MNKGKLKLKCHESWLTAKFILSLAETLKSHEGKTVSSKEMRTIVGTACKKSAALVPNNDKNMRGLDPEKTKFSETLNNFSEILKRLGIAESLSFKGRRGGAWTIIKVDVQDLSLQLEGVDIMSLLEGTFFKKKTEVKVEKPVIKVPVEEKPVKDEPINKEEVVETLSKAPSRKPRKKSELTVTRRSYPVELLREAYWIGILVRYNPRLKLEEIVNILTNNYLKEYFDLFKVSQDLKTRICSGKLSSIFSIASDGTLMYKPQGQGIVSFADLKAKYYLANDIQYVDMMIYDPHHEWRNNINTTYVDSFSVRSFSAAPQVCGCRAHWGCTPSALYQAWREFHLPIAGRYHYIGEPEIPLPWIKPEAIPTLENWAGLVTGEPSKELERIKNTVLLYLADIAAAA